jgi:uncharacterized protein DUF4388
MVGKTFRGDLSEVGLSEILEYLRSSQKTGLLTFKQDRIKKSLYIQDGNVIFGASNLQSERLGDLLLNAGWITKDQYKQSVALLTAHKRQGRILVEMGAITPKQLWQSVQGQIRTIVYSLFDWDHGAFSFFEGDLPSHENITADVEITELIVEGIRRIRHFNAVKRKFPSGDVTLSRILQEQKNPIKMESFEKHIYDLVDGQRSIRDICHESEIGDSEAMKVLYMLISIGYIRVKGRKMNQLPEREMTAEEAAVIIGNYNRMFSYLYRYMLHEVGPITEHVLNKYLSELKEAGSSVLKNVLMRKDGTLDVTAIQENLREFDETSKRDILLSSLNEFLYSTILALKRTLGPEHESRVIDNLRELRPEL